MFKKIVFAAIAATFMLSSCTSLKTSMKEPNVKFELYADNVDLSDQVEAEATSTKILGIDWSRLFEMNTGVIEGNSSDPYSLASIPVVGNYVTNTTANVALYELMSQNAGYDVVFYPQYSTKVVRPIGIGFLYKIETVKVKSRLGKLK
jgi:hypothetical protein